MNLTPNDIDIIEDGGMLDGQPVKLARSRGGFWIAVHKNKVLTGGSHPAIVKHVVSKMYPNFQPTMCKSENFSDSLVECHSKYLSDNLIKSGHDIYSIQDGNEIEFQITKQNIKVASALALLKNDSLYFPELVMPKKFAEAMAGASTEKALACNANCIKVK